MKKLMTAVLIIILVLSSLTVFAEDKNPEMSTQDIIFLIKQAHRIPAERDTLYNIIKTFWIMNKEYLM